MRSTSAAGERVGCGVAALALVWLAAEAGAALPTEERPPTLPGPLAAPSIDPPWVSPQGVPWDAPGITTGDGRFRALADPML
jgi:hypothetical protein